MSTEAATTSSKMRLRHHGEGGELFAIFIVNLFLKIVTLGIYHFWAKTRIRRYLWTHASFDGERFEYTGRGLELFLGFLKAMGVLILIVLGFLGLSAALAMIDRSLVSVAMLLISATFFYLIGVGIYGARRYMLSRTRWRSIRFAQTGSPFTYAKKMFGYTLLTGLTLGLYMPFMKNHLTSHMLNHMRFGNERVEYDGKGRDLFPRFLVTYLLTIPTLGLIWIWYSAAEARYYAEHTRFQQLRFRLTFTGSQLLWLYLGNLLLLVVTLGLAFPWVILRVTRFTFSHLEVSGQLDYAAIAQSAEKAPATGEGLVEAFDMGGI